MSVVVQQIQPVTKAAPDPSVHTQPVAFFDSLGNPITLTGTDDVLTGYTKPAASPIAATDTVIAAIGKLEAQVDAVDDLASAPGDQVGVGYVIDDTGGALAATDTLLEMIAKLEKRVADIEATP